MVRNVEIPYIHQIHHGFVGRKGVFNMNGGWDYTSFSDPCGGCCMMLHYVFGFLEQSMHP